MIELVIVVDNREKRSPIPQLLEKLEVPIHFATLNVADYLIGDVAVERKTMSDYIGSLISGGLHQELYKMSTAYELSYTAIIGFPSIELQARQMKRATLISSLVGTTFKRSPDGKQGIVSLLAPLETEYDFALALKFLHEKASEQKPRLPTFRINFSDADRLVYIMQSFPNIGEVKSKKLLSQFKTISNICNATPQQLAEILGEKRGLEFYLWLHKVYEEGKKEKKI